MNAAHEKARACDAGGETGNVTEQGERNTSAATAQERVSENNSLTIFTRAALMLAEADTIQKTKELKNLALTAADFARRKGMGEAAIQHCRSYALEAERKMGEMLAQTERNKGAKPGKTGNKALPLLDDTQPTLASFGLTKRESSEAQKLAAMPVETFEQVKSGKKTRVQTKREFREQGREARRHANREKVAFVAPAEVIAKQIKFATIMIDPPWDWGDAGDNDQFGRAKPDYATLSVEQLMGLPVAKLADVDCHLYCWITSRAMPKGFALLESWGFRFITILTWPKTSFGMGNYFRGQTEHILFGVKGSQPLKVKDAATLLPQWKRGKGGHSSKPVEIYDFIERCSPGPYLEMFSRTERKDWTAWGENS